MGGSSSWSCIFSAVHLTAATGVSSETERVRCHSGLLTGAFVTGFTVSLQNEMGWLEMP